MDHACMQYICLQRTRTKKKCMHTSGMGIQSNDSNDKTKRKRKEKEKNQHLLLSTPVSWS